MREPIEELYFNWLCAKVDSTQVPTPSLTHWNLLHILHSTEFVWIVIGDDNRVEDGLELRQEFVRFFGLEPDESWMWMGCSVLEMLLALCRRAEFDTEVSERDWFWIFMKNLELERLNDAVSFDVEDVQEVLHHLIWRGYKRNGSGGLFPIKKPRRNQLRLELWYQFCDYLIDQERLSEGG